MNHLQRKGTLFQSPRPIRETCDHCGAPPGKTCTEWNPGLVDGSSDIHRPLPEADDAATRRALEHPLEAKLEEVESTIVDILNWLRSLHPMASRSQRIEKLERAVLLIWKIREQVRR